jgi:N-acetylglucosamine transport system permease protein
MGKRSRTIFITVCTLPAVLLLVFFMIIPTVKVFSMSFYNVTGISNAADFIKFDNYQYMLMKDGDFYIALKNTLLLMVIVPACTLTLSLVFAFLLTQGKIREKGFYRTVFFFPSILSLTLVAILWSFIYNPSMGILNSFLTTVGLGSLARPWLGDAKVVLGAVAATLIWQAAGYYMIMYIAGIDSISPELYEAATIDGANEFHKFSAITVPLLWEIIRVTLIFSLSGVIVQSFAIVRVMTNGGPGTSSNVLLFYMYRQAFENSNFGYAMSIAVFTLLMGVLLSYLSNKLTKDDTLNA